MKPVSNDRTNHTFTLPGGTEENDLPVERSIDGEDTVHTSYWVPTEGELIQLEDGATVSLSVWGAAHPPVALGIGPALDAEERAGSVAEAEEGAEEQAEAATRERWMPQEFSIGGLKFEEQAPLDGGVVLAVYPWRDGELGDLLGRVLLPRHVERSQKAVEAWLRDSFLPAAADVQEAQPQITPEEARTLYAVWAGEAFDAEHLESVQPKLEAIAGESWR